MKSWIDFWDRDNAIYVNARHRDVHYRCIAEDIAALVPPGGTVLDYGCGEALHADRVAATAGRLVLSDAAPNVRASLAARFADVGGMSIASPEDVGAMADESLDLIVLNSVAQYLAPADLDRLFVLFRRLLAPGGVLLVADIVPPAVSALDDAKALLAFAAREGFLAAALAGLVRTALSDYREIRARLGLTCYDEADMLAKLAGAGFRAERRRPNIGHNQNRMAFLARPA